MTKVQAMRVVKSLIKKGLLKKEARKNKINGGSTSNLYTLLNPKSNNKDKKEGVSDRYPGSISQISGVVSHRYPNNTNIKRTNLNNVKRASSKEVVEKSKDEIEGVTKRNKEDINDIRRKIKESLESEGKCGFIKSEDSSNHKKTNSKNEYFKNSKIKEYHILGRYRSREKELLAREIAEELNDNHSLGAFRTIVDKISEQRIRIFLSVIKDTYLTGRIKKNRGAMFVSLAKAYAVKNNINLNFK